MSLTDLECRKTPPSEQLTKLSDTGGLQLWVYPNGTKVWRLAYRFGGKQKLFTLGRYPATTLLQARMGRDKAKVLLDEGSDPSHVKKLARIENAARVIPCRLFAQQSGIYYPILARKVRFPFHLDVCSTNSSRDHILSEIPATVAGGILPW